MVSLRNAASLYELTWSDFIPLILWGSLVVDPYRGGGQDRKWSHFPPVFFNPSLTALSFKCWPTISGEDRHVNFARLSIINIPKHGYTVYFLTTIQKNSICSYHIYLHTARIGWSKMSQCCHFGHTVSYSYLGILECQANISISCNTFSIIYICLFLIDMKKR